MPPVIVSEIRHVVSMAQRRVTATIGAMATSTVGPKDVADDRRAVSCCPPTLSGDCIDYAEFNYEKCSCQKKHSDTAHPSPGSIHCGVSSLLSISGQPVKIMNVPIDTFIAHFRMLV